MATPNPSELRWRRSSRSGNQGQCVEIASLPTTAMIRDSKNVGGVAGEDGGWPLAAMSAISFVIVVERPRLGGPQPVTPRWGPEVLRGARRWRSCWMSLIMSTAPGVN
ncbi:MAG: DUF397 domain-containing protein [Pseudonocardiaceae bacterium]|nr:DUF397 domain-containing protein [Pseudonocardiaceae bacterium]